MLVKIILIQQTQPLLEKKRLSRIEKVRSEKKPEKIESHLSNIIFHETLDNFPSELVSPNGPLKWQEPTKQTEEQLSRNEILTK